MITDRTFLEILTNPGDLCFYVAEDTTFAISRGPGHNFKVLVDGKFSDESTKEAREKTIDWIKDLLIQALEIVKKNLADPSSSIGKMFNPDKKPVEEANILSKEAIEKITLDLKKTGKAKTFS